MNLGKFVVWSAVGIAFGILGGVIFFRTLRVHESALVTGAVLEADADPRKQQPVRDVTITARSGDVLGESQSDASGLFRVPLRPAVLFGEEVSLSFRHPNYESYETKALAGGQLHVIRLTPKARQAAAAPGNTPVKISRVRVRYATKNMTTANVGSTVKTFEVVNKGNVPCERRPPCSPDGKWKATVGVLEIDAGDEKQLRNARVACIAGPCPFTAVDSAEYTNDGRTYKATVRNWSDTTTFLIQTEVTHTMLSELIRHSYPAIFDRTMSFTLSPTAQGTTIEAEVDGDNIVYPLGPSLKLSWATCSMESVADGTRLYRCELKPGYSFE